MPRSIWNGTITFGMVNVPVKLYSATESKSIHFHEVHVHDGARIEHRRVCSKEGKEVPYEEVVKGYEVSSGKYAVLETDEVKAAAGDRGKVVHIEEFVDASDIDPVFYEKTYYVGSRDDEDAYRLLHEALRRSGRAGIGRFSFHDREYLVAVRALDEVIALHTMRYADEVVSGDDLDMDRPSRKPSKREVAMAARLIDSMQQEFDPGDYEDTYREAVLALLKRKASGKGIDLTAEEEPEHGDDLMAAPQGQRGELIVPRAIWSGSLSFGLVNVPVQLVSAVRDLDYHFHQLHAKDKARIEQRRYCSKEEVEVVWEEIAHSYELKPRKEVIVTDEELASVQPRKTRTIDVEAFVDLAEVDPIYFDHPYFLVPVGESEGTLRAYQLLVDAMGSQERVRTKEYLAAVQVRDGLLGLTTMLFHDEVRPTSSIPTGGKKPSKRALGDALAIIEELSTEWDPESYTDCYRERLRKVIERKRKGQTIDVPDAEPEPKPVPDLMAALERTLENARAGRDLRDDGDGDGDLAALSRKELGERAKEAGIRGRTQMSKEELVEALAGEE